MTPWPSASCHARRASSVRKMCSPNSGQRGQHVAQPARSNAITSVGSTATHALIVGSPVNAAMSPMNVRLSACGDVDVLARLAVDELDAAALDDVERRVADRVLVEHLARLRTTRRSPCLANHASFASESRGNSTSSSRSGNRSLRITCVVATAVP